MMTKTAVLVCLGVVVLLSACAPYTFPGTTPDITPTSGTTPTESTVEPSPLPPATPLLSPTVTAAGAGPTPTEAALYPAAVQAARAAAARDLNVPLSSVTIVSFTPVDWRNGCLEVNRLEQPCTDVIVPGYQVILSVDGQQVEYRTNLDGSLVVFAGPDVTPVSPAPDTVVFTWHREGGIAGFCDELRVSDTSEAIASNCQRGVSDEVGRDALLPAEKDQLDIWLASFRPLNATFKDKALADAMLQTLALAGRGQTEATAGEQQAMLNWASAVYTRIVSDVQR